MPTGDARPTCSHLRRRCRVVYWLSLVCAAPLSIMESSERRFPRLGRNYVYSKIFRSPAQQEAVSSQHSLSPIVKRVGTTRGPVEKQFNYAGLQLDDVNDLPTAISSVAPAYTTSLERPKPAIQKGLRANFTKLVPHLTAIAVTVAVVQLSFRNQYWMDLVDPNQTILPGITQAGALNALQLAAKLHEMILVASLSNIVMHVAQAHLIGNHGLPLGLLTNSFMVGSGDFVRRKAFWSSIWTSRSHFWRFWLLSLLATVIATLSGPSSAIAVIPSLNWFPLDKAFDNAVQPYFVFNESTELWPTRVTEASLNAPNSGNPCTDPDSFDVDACPAGGFSETYEWSGNLLFTNSSVGTNISFPDARGDTRRVLRAQSCASSFDGRASAMSLNTFVSGAMTAFWSFAQTNFEGRAMKAAQPRLTTSASIWAPKVEVICNGHDYNATDVSNRSAINFPTFAPDPPLPVPDDAFEYVPPLNASNFTWVSLSESADGPSIGAVVRVPWIYKQGEQDPWEQATEYHACSIYAQWVPVDVWYEPRTDDQVTFSTKGPLSNTCLDIPHSRSSDLPVKNMTIGLAYANAINQEIDFVSGNMPAIYSMLQQCTFNDGLIPPYGGLVFKAPFVAEANSTQSASGITVAEARQSRATMISTLLAGVVTDGLARIAGNGLFPYSAPMFLTNKTDDNGGLIGRFPITTAAGGEDDPLNATVAAVPTWLRIDPVFARYGYGYQWEGSKTAQFGILVLLIHLALAVLHTLVVLYKIYVKREGMAGSWSTLGELLALALNSSPSPALQNTCAGVSEARTWRQIVTVRETYPAHLELVVGQEAQTNYPLPQADKYYGAFPEPGRQ